MDTASKKLQLQELYHFLDHRAEGNTLIAWYGQLRAEEYTHDEALAYTVDHFRLWSYDWWKARFA